MLMFAFSVDVIFGWNDTYESRQTVGHFDLQ